MRVTDWQDRHTARARAGYVETLGDRAAGHRAAEIAGLDAKDWRGRRVYRLTCRGDFGNGPHDQFVPEGLLWSLIALPMWRCAFHQ